ncbi:hypothetical protein CEE69_07875 [Rhodopirellula bahusiensis]|uniref:Uncharacterized protein n=1 Tax=Rhodopirellula bahusiensis TaxID=2014065 RepID=A0A2G1W9X3_9BACT|nr:hypothetical protein CEE69_07875 [Rhodopirellula bahusiensis]
MVVWSQDASAGRSDQSETKPAEVGLLELQLLTRDMELSKEVGLTTEQRKTILVAMQKYRDATMKGFRAKTGERVAPDEMKRLMDAAVRDAMEAMSKEQAEKLLEVSERKKAERAATPRPPRFSSEKLNEMRELSQIQSKLMRLSYDTELSEELELTAEQRVELSEVQREYRSASEELRKDSKTMDLGQRNELLQKLVMDSQTILSPDQSEKLAFEIKVERLKREHGDEFALINGLADDYGLDDRAKAKLSEKIQEVRKDYYDDWMALKKKSMEAIINELPRKHREEAEAAVQDFVDEDPRDKMNRSRFSLPVRK